MYTSQSSHLITMKFIRWLIELDKYKLINMINVTK